MRRFFRSRDKILRLTRSYSNLTDPPSWSLARLSLKVGQLGGLVVQDHFRINRFANGWLLSGYGRTTLNLEFSTQTLVWYGLGISISSAVSTLIILIVVRRRRNSPARVSPRPPETLIP